MVAPHSGRLTGNPANSATLDPSMTASITGPLGAAAKTPLGPVATSIGSAISNTVRNFDASGTLRMVNFPGGGAARIETAEVTSASGARVRVSGGDGVTYYWPAGRLRVDGSIQMTGGGLPTGRINLTHPRNGAPMSGMAQFAPYTAKGSRLALAPIRFAAGRDGATQLSTVATLDGAFSDGRVRALRVPISGRIGTGGKLGVRHRLCRGALCLLPGGLAPARADAPSGLSDRFGDRLQAGWRRFAVRRADPQHGAERAARPIAAAVGGGRRANRRQGVQFQQARDAPWTPGFPDRLRCGEAQRHFLGQGAERNVWRRSLDDRQYRAANERHRRALALL